jgi:hypothetical protein
MDDVKKSIQGLFEVVGNRRKHRYPEFVPFPGLKIHYKISVVYPQWYWGGRRPRKFSIYGAYGGTTC